MMRKEIKQIRKHFIHTDYYEYLLGRFFSSWLVLWIKDAPVTPNQLTLVSIFLNICAALSFSRGDYAFMLAGALLIQLAFIFDFADGQLARYKCMTTGFGKWMDILGDAISDCAVYAGLAYGVYARTENKYIVFLMLFTCALQPLYCLHRQIRDNIGSGSNAAQKKNPAFSFKWYLQAFKLFPMNKKLIISLGTALAVPEITLILVTAIVTAKFVTSVIIFIFQSKRPATQAQRVTTNRGNSPQPTTMR